MSCLSFTLGELISMTEPARAPVWGVTTSIVIVILPIVLVRIVAVVLIVWVASTTLTTTIWSVEFPTIVIVHWLASHIIDTIAVKVVWIAVHFAGLSFPLYFRNAFVIVEVVNVSENLHKSQTVSIASVGTDFGMWARFL